MDVKVRDLCEGVDASVGAARAVELEVAFARRLQQRAGDFALNRPRVLLDLPAAIAAAGVFDGQFEAHLV